MYSIGLDSNIYICGINERCLEIERNLTSIGFRNIRKGDSNLKDLVENDISEYIYIIALQNAMKHDEIAEHLYCRGARKIVYLPMKGFQHAHMMRQIYNDLLYSKKRYYCDVPEYIRFTEKDDKLSKIREDDSQVTFWADIDNLYVNNVYPDRKMVSIANTMES